MRFSIGFLKHTWGEYMNISLIGMTLDELNAFIAIIDATLSSLNAQPNVYNKWPWITSISELNKLYSALVARKKMISEVYYRAMHTDTIKEV